MQLIDFLTRVSLGGLHDEFEIVTLPFNPGVTICKKIKLTKQMIYDQ